MRPQHCKCHWLWWDFWLQHFWLHAFLRIFISLSKNGRPRYELLPVNHNPQYATGSVKELSILHPLSQWLFQWIWSGQWREMCSTCLNLSSGDYTHNYTTWTQYSDSTNTDNPQDSNISTHWWYSFRTQPAKGPRISVTLQKAQKVILLQFLLITFYTSKVDKNEHTINDGRTF